VKLALKRKAHACCRSGSTGANCKVGSLAPGSAREDVISSTPKKNAQTKPPDGLTGDGPWWGPQHESWASCLPVPPRAYFGNPLPHALTWRLPHELEPPPPRHFFPFPSSRRRHHPLRHPNHVSTSGPARPPCRSRRLPPRPSRLRSSTKHEAAHQRGRGRGVRARGPDRPQEPGRAARAPPRAPRGAGRRPGLRDGEPPRRLREAGPRGAHAAAAVPGGLGDRPRQAHHQGRHRARHLRHRPPRRLRRPGCRRYRPSIHTTSLIHC
jgi:hypothetical protein